MGECLSICNNQRNDFEEKKPKDTSEEEEEDYDDLTNSLPETMGRTKKNKTRIPKNVIVDDDDEILPTIKTNNKESNNNDDIEKFQIARRNWEHLIDKLIKKKIDILREMVKKEKEEESESDEEGDVKDKEKKGKKNEEKKKGINKNRK